MFARMFARIDSLKNFILKKVVFIRVSEDT